MRLAARHWSSFYVVARDATLNTSTVCAQNEEKVTFWLPRGSGRRDSQAFCSINQALFTWKGAKRARAKKVCLESQVVMSSMQSSSSKSLAPLEALYWTTEQIPVKCLGNTKVLHPVFGIYVVFTIICLLNSRTSSFVTIPGEKTASSTGKWQQESLKHLQGHPQLVWCESPKESRHHK